VLRTFSYVDGVNFARRASAPAHFAAGLRDAICPPSTVFAAYNHYGTRAAQRPDPTTDRRIAKRIEVYPFNGHEGGDAVHGRRQLDWLRHVMPAPLPIPRVGRRPSSPTDPSGRQMFEPSGGRSAGGHGDPPVPATSGHGSPSV
jgi:hypothetical protein